MSTREESEQLTQTEAALALGSHQRNAGKGASKFRHPALIQFGLFSIQLINAIYNVLAEHMLSKDGADPLVFSTYRDLAAAPVLYTAALGMEGLVPLQQADVPRVALQGFLGVFCNQILFLVGVQLTSATFASIINLSLPAFAALLALALRVEPFRWTPIAGVALAITGGVTMKQKGDGIGISDGSALGTGILLLGALASAMYLYIQKTLLVKYPAVTMTSWEYVFGFLFMASAAGFFVQDHSQWALSTSAQVALLFAVIFNSVLKYALTTMCNKHVSVVILTVWATTVPILTAMFSKIFLGQPILQMRYLGSIPIIMGTYLVTKGRLDQQRLEQRDKKLPEQP